MALPDAKNNLLAAPHSGPMSFPGQRSLGAEAGAKAAGYVLKEVGKRKYLTHDNTDYLFLNGTITDFLSEPIISSGATFNREHVRLDPASPYLETVYQEFLSENSRTDASRILSRLVSFVNRKLGGFRVNEELPEVIKDLNCHFGYFDRNPIINIDEFIKKGKGVCRHRALLNAYFIDRLMKDNRLAKGRVYVQRGNLQFGHAWTFYKPYRSSSIYLADSMWYEKAHEITKPQDINNHGYNKHQSDLSVVIQNKYFSIPRYSHCTEHADKFKFVNQILDEKDSAKRRKLLNDQYNVGCLNDLKISIKATHVAERGAIYAKHVNYKAVLADIEIIEETENLHTRNFDGIQTPAKRTQFIESLLMKYGKERRAILENQKGSHAQLRDHHLDKIENELTGPNKKQYEQYRNYNALLSDIKVEKLSRPYDDLPLKTREKDPRQQFVLELLKGDPQADLKIILSKHTLTDLQSLLSSLNRETPDRAQLYRRTNNPNYCKLRTQLNHEFSLRPFRLLKTNEDRTILIDNLRQKTFDLNNQNLDDLVLLHKYLLENYKNNQTFDDLTLKVSQKIDQRILQGNNNKIILCRTLSHIRNIIAKQKLKVIQGCCCQFFWTNGTCISIGRETVRVPKNAAAIYNLIPDDLQLYNKSEEELNRLLSSIRRHAKNANKEKSGRDEDTTLKFYQLIANEGNTAQDILKNLQDPDNFFAPRNEYRLY